jgi:hypothetical protein
MALNPTLVEIQISILSKNTIVRVDSVHLLLIEMSTICVLIMSIVKLALVQMDFALEELLANNVTMIQIVFQLFFAQLKLKSVLLEDLKDKLVIDSVNVFSHLFVELLENVFNYNLLLMELLVFLANAKKDLTVKWSLIKTHLEEFVLQSHLQ